MIDVENERYQATYDSDRDPPSLAVIAVVSIVLGRDPQALAPLHSVIDTDALDELATGSVSGRACCESVTFCYERLEVTVGGDGVIEVVPEK